MSISVPTSSATALNSQLVARGDLAIPGLEKLPAAELKALKDGLRKFDEFARESSKNPVFGAIANGEAMKFLRDLAMTVSNAASPESTPTTAERVFTGMCGGGGGDSYAPPAAPAAPLAAEPPPPPSVAQPPVAETPPAPTPPIVAQPPAAPVVVAPPATTKPNPVVSPTPVALGTGSAIAQGDGAAVVDDDTVVAATATAAGTDDDTVVPATAAGTGDVAGIAQAFGQRFGQLMQQNPLAAMLAMGALGSALGASGFNPLQLNGAANGSQTANTAAASTSGAAQAAGTGSATSTTAATPGTANAEGEALAASGTRGMMFEDKVALMMSEIVKKMQGDIEKRLEKLKAQAEAADKKKDGGGGGGGFLGGLMGGGGGGGMLGSILGVVGNMVVPGIGGIVGGMLGGGGGGAAAGGEAGGAAGTGGGQQSRNIEFEMLKNDMQKLSQMQQAFSGVLNAMNETAMNAIRSIK